MQNAKRKMQNNNAKQRSKIPISNQQAPNRFQRFKLQSPNTHVCDLEFEILFGSCFLGFRNSFCLLRCYFSLFDLRFEFTECYAKTQTHKIICIVALCLPDSSKQPLRAWREQLSSYGRGVSAKLEKKTGGFPIA